MRHFHILISISTHGFPRLKPKYDKPLSNYAFKFNLRRYRKGSYHAALPLFLRPVLVSYLAAVSTAGESALQRVSAVPAGPDHGCGYGLIDSPRHAIKHILNPRMVLNIAILRRGEHYPSVPRRGCVGEGVSR